VYLGGDYKLCCTGLSVELLHMRPAVLDDTGQQSVGKGCSSDMDVV
jgi:hypothetical protein